MTVIEPQRVLWGKKGVTFRLWDWNRKYNKKGELDLKHGKTRELHVEECLKRIDLNKQELGYIQKLNKISSNTDQ